MLRLEVKEKIFTDSRSENNEALTEYFMEDTNYMTHASGCHELVMNLPVNGQSKLGRQMDKS